MKRVVVVGAGMGGLAAALRLRRHGFSVRLLEARAEPGGLASGFELGGLSFDAGPYILLDRPGLDWAFQELGLELDERVPLTRVEDVYEVRAARAPPVRILGSLEATAAGLEQSFPGCGERYVRFVRETAAVYERLHPLLRISRPRALDLIRTGAWRHIPFLLRPLAAILARSGLPGAVRDALGIWTHVAGQRLAEAPSPLAFVPALIHGVGCFVPRAGIGSIPRALAAAATEAGVEIAYGTRVAAIRVEHGRVTAVETEAGERLPVDAVVSDAPGLATYLELVAATPPPARAALARLPLQSPGTAVYLAVRGAPRPPYLRFVLPGGDSLCQLLVRPDAIGPARSADGWQPARLIAPMRHAEAEAGGAHGQDACLEALLAERWWQDEFSEHRVLLTRTPRDWGREFELHRESMNPVMTARFMRAGRLAHRSPHARGLYLAGSATHPGQWVSFCAISGVLAADALRQDLA